MFPLVFMSFMAITQVGTAQAPPPPPSSGSKGDNTNKGPGGGAPLGEGLGLTLALVAGYGVWKSVAAWRRRRTLAGS